MTPRQKILDRIDVDVIEVIDKSLAPAVAEVMESARGDIDLFNLIVRIQLIVGNINDGSMFLEQQMSVTRMLRACEDGRIILVKGRDTNKLELANNPATLRATINEEVVQ